MALPKLNRTWHEAHRMPERATLEQRIQWHQAHVRHCGCRPMPPSIQAAIRQHAARGKGKQPPGSAS